MSESETDPQPEQPSANEREETPESETATPNPETTPAAELESPPPATENTPESGTTPEILDIEPETESATDNPDSKDRMQEAYAILRPRLGMALLAAIWLLVCLQLSMSWRINPQYAHGWLVPFICLYLAFKTNHPSITSTASKDRKKPNLWLWILGSLSIILFFPAWIIREANSDWRLINVVLVGLAMLTTVAMLHNDGGWGRVKALAFPILFFLVAVPLPLAKELEITLWLQGRVSEIIVDLLLLLGYHVELQGHVINAPPFGQVGVDEACSGIRGLQASLVVSLFLGHYFRFSLSHRLQFCFLGLAFALFANVARAFFLAIFAARGKLDFVAKWHDTAGLVETLCILIALFICSQLLKGRTERSSLGEETYDWGAIRTAPPLGFSIGGLTVIAATLIVSYFHYYLKEKHMEDVPTLQIDFATGSVFSVENEPSQQIRTQLHYEEAQSIQWQAKGEGQEEFDPTLEYWQGFACSWAKGGACKAVLSTHSPDACLPLTGLKPSPGKLPDHIVNVGNYKVPFECYQFEHDLVLEDRKIKQTVFVFRCFWPKKIEGDKFPSFPQGGYDFKNRVLSTWEGRRNTGGTMIALCVTNVKTKTEALAKLQAQVSERISVVH